MKATWFSKMKSEAGFTLIEAIISVLIVGIAVIPVSMVFSNTIITTQRTRKQMEANEIAQQTMEGLKKFSLLEVENRFPTGSVITVDSTSTPPEGMEAIPSGYEVRIYTSDAVNLAEYKLPGSPHTLDVDAEVVIPGGVNDPGPSPDNIVIEGVSYDLPLFTGTRYIEVVAERGGDIKFNYYQNYPGGSASEIVSSISITHEAVSFEMGSYNTGTPVNTMIIVNSSRRDPFKIYIYEDASNTVQALTEVRAGNVSIMRNMRLGDAAHESTRILEMTVEVYESGEAEPLAKVNSTKINE